MYEIIQDFNHDIFAEKEGPFVSIYQNTHRTPSEVQQDTLAFKNHLKTVESILKENYDKTVMKEIMEQLYELKEEKTFWNTNSLAVAILATKHDYVVFRLNSNVTEKAIVADSFHTKPLIRHFQTRGTFDVLALDKVRFSLYTCTQDMCHKVEFEDDVPVTKEEVLGTLDKDEYLSHASYNGTSNEAMYHGHDDNKDIMEKDVERYFRYVDQFINNTYSKPTKRSVVLWALPEHQGEFRKVSKNKYLLDDGINKSNQELTEDKVLKKAWDVIKPRYEKEIDEMIERYHEAKSKSLATDDLDEVAEKTVQKNIDTAIISSDKTIPGKLNLQTGTIKKGKLDNPVYDDVLDDLAEKIVDQGGTVIVLKEEKMPTDTGIAAIFRY